MNTPAGPLSPPASVTSNEWLRQPSSYAQDPYSPPLSLSQGPHSPSPPVQRRGDLATPPVSGFLNDMNSDSGYGGNSFTGNGFGGMAARPSDSRGNPSPPMSMRLSSATTMSIDGQRRKQIAMEESLAQHYAVLKRYLAQSLKDEASDGKPNRARDKLLRLSGIQFQELSTDVYDELLRRQAAAANQAGPGAPAYLLPKDNFHPKRNQARQKLSTLPSPRFRALATDVFYELERRIPQFAATDIERRGSPANSLRGPPSRTGTPTGMRPGSRDAPPRRLGPAPRQGSFGGHVMSGLGMPVAAGPNDFNRPAPKLSQSNTVVPNKSYLVEDDDDEGDSSFGTRRNTGNTNRSFDLVPPVDAKAHPDPPSTIGGVDGTLQLEAQRRETEKALKKLEDGQRAFDKSEAEWASLRMSIEDKLSEALNMNQRLQAEMDKLKSHHTEKEQDLQARIDQLSQQNREQSGGGEWRERYEQLNEDHDHLQRDHQAMQRHLQDLQGNHQDLQRDHQDLQRTAHEQQDLADRVRQDTSSMWTEMRAIADRDARNGEREEKLVEQIHRLEDELADWKDRYASATTQAGNTSFHSSASAIPYANASTQDSSLLRADGLVPDVALTAFHIALESVLRTAHTSEPTATLERSKAVVSAVRTICHDVPDATAPSTDAASQQRAHARARVAATATNFITAARNYAQARGLSPVSLLDAAASHLAAAIVELVRLAGLRPSSQGAEGSAHARARSVASSTTASLKSEPYRGARDTRYSEAESIYSNQTAASSHPAPPAATSSYRDLNQAQRGQLGHGALTNGASSNGASSNGASSHGALFNGASTNGTLTNGSSTNGTSTAAKPVRRTPTPNAAPMLKEHDPEVEHLKLFLDAQTERLVPAIQALVSSVRTVDEPATVHAHIAAIANTVAAIMNETARVADVSPNTPAATSSAASVTAARTAVVTAVRVLAACRARLLERDDEGRGIGGHADWKAYVGTLPPLAFEIAREVKEVARRVEVMAEGREEDVGGEVDEEEEDFR